MMKTLSGILSGLIFLVLGVYLFINPGLIMDIICTTIGIVLMVAGAITVAPFIADRIKGKASAIMEIIMCVMGVILIAMGVFVITNSAKVIAIIPWMLGIVLLIRSISEIRNSFILKKISYDNWWITLIMGILMAVIAIFVIKNPYTVATIQFKFIGGLLIAEGVLSISGTILNSVVMQLHKNKKGVAIDPNTGEEVEVEIYS